MAKHRIRKYSRRTASGKRRGRVGIIILAISAFLLLSVVVSVAIGISLGKRAQGVDTDADEKYDLGSEPYESQGKSVTSVEAYHFPIDAAPSDYVYQEIYDLSVAVRHKDGSLAYYLETGEKFPIDEMGERSFKVLCSDAKTAEARVCAYFYVTSFTVRDKQEREIIKAYEIALISEIAESGADDILLLGLSADEKDIAEVERFVRDAARAANNVPLGVAVDRATVAKTSDGEYVAARLRSSCDYLALDLTDLTVKDGESRGRDEEGKLRESLLSEILREYRYYIKSYPMRLLFAQSEYKLYVPALELGAENIQIVGE